MLESELFRSQMAALNEEQRHLIWRSLNRARDGKLTLGVTNPWDGNYLVWPCGPHAEYRVILRRLERAEVAAETGELRDGFYLICIEPSPI
jgi:hypothetical protein